MKFLTIFFLLCLLSAPSPSATPIVGLPPVALQQFSSQPLIKVSSPLPPAPALLQGSNSVSSPPLTMKILVLDGDTNEISYQAITTFLREIGVPFDAVVLSGITPDASGNRLAGLALSDPSTGRGNYQGIILTNSTFGVCNPTCASLLSAADWSKLDTYASTFKVRLVSYFTWPEARWGIIPADSGVSYTSANALQARLTSAGAAVFSELNTANPIPVGGNSSSGIFAYLAAPTAATNETTTPLLSAGAYTLAVTHTTASGEESLALTMDNYPALLHSRALNYGIINWVTRGVFLGSRKIYFSAQIDDMLVGDLLYAPTRPECPGVPGCPAVRTTAQDLQALNAWQLGVRQNPLFQNFRETFSYVGLGTTRDFSPPGDPLLTAVTQLGAQFDWVSHTWGHDNLDCYTLTEGQCNPATVQESLDDLQRNINVAQTLGISIDPLGLVTPYTSGLTNSNFLNAAAQLGIQSVVYPGFSPTPNTGIVNPLVPSILEIPRVYTNLFDNVSSPLTGVNGSWPDQYNALYGPKGTKPQFQQDQTYSQILDNESDNILLLNMLSDELTPIGIHISGIANYDGTHSLFSDLMDATIAKYKALFTVPVTTLRMGDMIPLLKARASYNSSQVAGVYTPGVNVVLTTVNAGTIPVTGACSQATCPTYGGQMQDSVAMAAGSSQTLFLSAGQGVTLTSVTLNPASVAGGTSTTGTVTLNGAAPIGGVTVGLSSDSPSAIVPAGVVVNAGSLAASFTLTTKTVTTSTNVTITAGYKSVNATAPLTLTPVVALSSVSLNPTTVTGGNPSTGTVTLNFAAPAGGVAVALSSDSSSATIPTTVDVAAGNTTATFTVTTKAVTLLTNVTITANYNDVNATALLTITPVLKLSSVSLNPTSVTSGNPSTGTVTLNFGAPPGGISVALSSNNSSATVPTTVSVAAGNTTASFTVSTKAILVPVLAIITANYNGIKATANFTILPPTPVALSSLTLNPTTVRPGSPSTGTLILTGVAPAGGITINVASSIPSVASVPASVIIPAGSKTASFVISTRKGSYNIQAVITATYRGASKTAILTIH